MLGWMISVHRQLDGGSTQAQPGCPRGDDLAVWQTGMRGLEWLDDFVNQGSAIGLGGNGYPLWYTAKAKHLIPLISGSPPMARDTWACGPNDVLLPGWHDKAKIDSSAIALCRADEWLVIEAWDES